MTGKIHVGIGGWTYAPWRGVFYPKGLSQKKELEFASRALGSIEINGTFYSLFKPDSWRRWRDETPDDFVFSVKAAHYCTNRKTLATAAEPITRFLQQGMSQLGAKLGPINWQLMPTKQFNPDDIEAFFRLLPRQIEGVRLRHAIEVRHASFCDKGFYKLARRHRVAIVCADHETYPAIDEPTADFAYARVMRSKARLKAGYSPRELDEWAKRCEVWKKRGDVCLYFISGAKERNPAAAQALIERLR